MPLLQKRAAHARGKPLRRNWRAIIASAPHYLL
jgi:hypothetical protein